MENYFAGQDGVLARPVDFNFSERRGGRLGGLLLLLGSGTRVGGIRIDGRSLLIDLLVEGEERILHLR